MFSVDDEGDAPTLPGTAPTSMTQPVPSFRAAAAPVPTEEFAAEDEPVVEEAPVGTFDEPMELNTEGAAPPYVEPTSLEQELYSMEEPVVAAPEEFMPLMADEAEALQPPPAAARFAPEAEPVFAPEPEPEPEPAPEPFVAPPPVFEAPPAFEPPPAFAPAPAHEPPPPPFTARPLEPEPMVEEDDGAATVVFRAGDAPPWSQPTTELSFETRAQAMAKQQAEPSAPVFEEVAEGEPEPFEPPPPPPVFQPVVAAPAFEPPPPAPAPEPVVASPEAPEESFAALAPPAAPEPPPVEEPAPSAAAEVAVPVDQVAQIAQRVVAQISERVVREIAWEIIPDLAEALIKKEIERLKAELERA
jgi:hypothetical protein